MIKKWITNAIVDLFHTIDFDASINDGSLTIKITIGNRTIFHKTVNLNIQV
jgi:hypothetical protein